MVWGKYGSKDSRRIKRCGDCDKEITVYLVGDKRCLECITGSE